MNQWFQNIVCIYWISVSLASVVFTGLFPHRQCWGCWILPSPAHSTILLLRSALLLFLRFPPPPPPATTAQYKCSTTDRPYGRRRPVEFRPPPDLSHGSGRGRGLVCQTDGRTDRQTDSQPEGGTEAETDRDRDTQTHRHTDRARGGGRARQTETEAETENSFELVVVYLRGT